MSTSTAISRLLALVLVGSLAAPAAGAPRVGSDGPGSKGRIASRLTAYLDSLARAEAFSGAALLAKGDEPALRRAWGLASRQFPTPNRPDTRFNLGSVNKVFTQLAINQLAAKGALQLTDTIGRYLPDYRPEGVEKITVQMLVEHRAGIPDVFGKRYAATNHGRIRDIAGWMELIRGEPLRYEPGSRQEYSNGGYILLGAIIEKVSGQSYYEYVRDHIFEPAGMSHTDSYAIDDPIENRAAGYTKAAGRWVENAPMLPGRGSSAGGGYSTLDDLFRFTQAIRAGKLGFARGVGNLGIAGGFPGVNAVLELDGDWTLIVLANMDPPAAERVADRARGFLRDAGVGAGSRSVERRVGGPGEEVVGADRGADVSRRPEETFVPAGGVDVPMKRAGHMPAVEVRVNGQGPFLFGIDTGGEGTARVSSALARRLGLAKVGSAFGGDPSGRNRREIDVVAVDSISIAGSTFSGLQATIRTEEEPSLGEGVEGILGFGLFAECLFTLDYPLSRVRLERGALPPENGDDILPYRDVHGIPAVMLRIGDVRIEANVDAGFMGGISLPESLATRLPLEGSPRVIGHAKTLSNEFDVKAAELKGDVSIGGMVFRTPTVEFQPLFPMANLGDRVLRDLEITFDQKNHRLRLRRVS